MGSLRLVISVPEFFGTLIIEEEAYFLVTAEKENVVCLNVLLRSAEYMPALKYLEPANGLGWKVVNLTYRNGNERRFRGPYQGFWSKFDCWHISESAVVTADRSVDYGADPTHVAGFHLFEGKDAAVAYMRHLCSYWGGRHRNGTKFAVVPCLWKGLLAVGTTSFAGDERRTLVVHELLIRDELASSVDEKSVWIHAGHIF